MRYWLSILLLLLACGTASATVDPLTAPYVPSMDTNCAHAQYSNTSWLTDWTQKVRQDSGTNPGSACTLTVYATQNEFADFQVHYRDSGSGTAGLKIFMNACVQSSPSSYTISAATTPPPNILVYREAYMDVTIKSATAATFYNSTGYFPDILIPAVDPYWGQTTNAWPFTVAASNNQSAWIDVLVPSAAPAGYYLCSVVVQTGCPGSCITISTMPITIAVWQWASAGFMPSKTSLAMEMSGFGYNGLCTQMYSPNSMSGTTGCTGYPGSGGSNDGGVTATDIDGDRLMADHRAGVSGPENIYPQAGSFSTYTSSMQPIIGGGSSGGCTHTSQYCPVLPGAYETTVGLGSAGNSFTQPIWCNWQQNFIANGWGTASHLPLYHYLQDEPMGQSQYTTVYNNGTAYHAYIAPGQACNGVTTGIPELVTTDIFLNTGSQGAANTLSTNICGTNTCIFSAFDIMVVLNTTLEPAPSGPLQSLSNYTTWLSGSNDGIPRLFWGYQDCTSGGSCSNGTTGGSSFTNSNLAIDGLPSANRVMPWLLYEHGQTGYLYYATDICMVPASQGAQCGYPSHNYDPWQSVYYSGMWGDGTLVYAGSLTMAADNYMGAAVTTPLILPSVRLKLIRDSEQDYEYLYKLNALGYSSTVNTQLTSWITNSYTFETTGSGLNAARVALGNFMHALSYPASGTVAPSRAGMLLAKGR